MSADLDRRAAELVMGWAVGSGRDKGCWGYIPLSENRYVTLRGWRLTDGDFDIITHKEPFSPSTRWDHAGMVVEKMRERHGHTMELWAWAANTRRTPEYDASFSECAPESDLVLTSASESATTGPAAITAAAVAAMEQKDGTTPKT